MKKHWLIILSVIILVFLWTMYELLSPESSKLAEATFYKDNNIELKVILVHENLPLHYVGNSYSVACQSKNTASPATNDEYELKTHYIEAGWNLVPGAYLGQALGDDSNLVLKGLVEEAKKLHLVKDEMTVVALGDTGIKMSFDGCRTFSSWEIKNSIPSDLIIETTPEFEACVAGQKKDAEMNFPSYGDCADMKFTGTNVPEFEVLTASDDGHLSFKVTSGAFIDGQAFLFETKDFGKTWKLVP
jgi:hypothetical protein